MKRKQHVFLITLIAAFVAIGQASYCAAEAIEKRIPLPIGEMTEVLIKWWEDTGNQIRKTEPETGCVRLYAEKGMENWKVDLAPYSALATRVSVNFSGITPETRIQQFWDHISHYLHNPLAEEPRASDEHIPTAVLSKIESVVCIDARLDENDIQFSGFIIDTDGLVLCTAHDLGNNQRLSVTLFDGRELEAKLLFKDSHADLSILQIALRPKTAIRLSEGRNLLGMGETIYSVGCPVNLRGTVYAGTIDSPPRRMNDLPLWQVHMEIYHGSSGSPVFDANGNIVAMVKGRYRGTTTTGFLIPMETIFKFLKEKTPL
jgi:serine protease Do